MCDDRSIKVDISKELAGIRLLKFQTDVMEKKEMTTESLEAKGFDFQGDVSFKKVSEKCLPNAFRMNVRVLEHFTSLFITVCAEEEL